MKLVTPQQMRIIDRTAIDEIGIPGIVLMENAAMQVAMKAVDMLKGVPNANITVVAGSGNNGGDAFAVVRHLLSMGYSVSAYSLTSFENLSGDALTNALILRNLGLDVPIIKDESLITRLAQSCQQSNLVIDGLLGTGLNRDVEGLYAEVIDTINSYSKLILSIDIASGVDGLTGKIRGNCIRADATVTFFLPKTGMVQYPGLAYQGELTVSDIGIPYALADSFDTLELTEKDQVKGLLPKRPQNSHKGTFGKVLIIAGSKGMTGAAYLSGSAAYATGTGLVRLVLPQSCIETLSVLLPEAVYEIMPDKDGHLSLNDPSHAMDWKSNLQKLIGDADAVLVGPGLSCNEDTLEVLKAITEVCEKPVVFDADSLNLLAQNKYLLENLRCEAVITPHPAEMARLAGLETNTIQNDRIGIARHFADEFGLTVVLKGAGTIISTNDGRTSINPTGNNGMATAGSGDVLAGIIVSLLGQGMVPYDAAVAGVYLHGLAGDFAAKQKGQASMVASDILAHIPQTFFDILEIRS